MENSRLLRPESVRKRAQAARGTQNKRFANEEATDTVRNTDIRVGEMRPFCRLQDERQSLMRVVMSQLNLSMEAHHSVLKLPKHCSNRLTK